MALKGAAAIVAATVAALAACSGGVEGAGRAPREGPPVRIVAGNTAAAEFLATILGNAGPTRIAAVPEQVDAYSHLDFGSGGWEAVPRFARYEAEPLIAMHPDLVVTHEWQGIETTEVLRAHGVEVVSLASANGWEDVRASILAVGEALGCREDAERAAERLDGRIEALRAGATTREGLRALEYSNNGTGGWTAGLDTTADALIRLAGMRNAAAELGIRGHAALDSERLIAIDPDVIVVGSPARDDVGSPTKAVLEGTAAYATLQAVAKGRIVVLPAALLSTDSPCLVDAAERLALEVDAVVAPAGERPR